jgi:hypothetical protein
MPRKKKPEPDDKEQSARFVEIAQQIQCENDQETFEKKIKKVLLVKKKS